jgi:hypothetical protein
MPTRRGRGIRLGRACQGCGRPIAAGAWCASCGTSTEAQRPAVESHERLENLGGHWSPDRSRTEQAAFRAGLVRLHGEQCNAGMPHLAEWFPGLTRRCPRTSGLQAHHGKSGMPDALLCREHHGAVDEHAR